MNRDDRILLAAILLFSLMMIGVGAIGSAQDRGRMTDAIALHRLCVSETSWRTSTVDCDGIHAVLRFRMDHIRPYRDDTLAQAAARYSGGRITRTTGARPWVGELNPACDEPATWPGHLPWAGRGRQGRNARGCRRVYQRVLDILHGERDHIVRGPVHDWGAVSISDGYRADNPDAQPAQLLGETANDFWELGRYTLRFGDS